MPRLVLVGAFIITFTVSQIGVRWLIRWTSRNEIVDIPNERSSHVRPTPRGGGLLIVLTTLVAWIGYLLTIGSVPSASTTLAYLFGSALVAFVSWYDDLKSLPSWLRFSVHSAAALLVLLVIGYWQRIEIPVVGAIQLGRFGLPLTFLWIVGLTNAYNFMDGIDGLAGGQAVVAGFAWAILGWQVSQAVTLSLGLFLAAASLGFLAHNWPPATIFMGDVGSAFLGYTFAVLPLFTLRSSQVFLVPALLFVWPFAFDTSFTLLRRLRNGENIFTAHRSHLYQRLIICGLSHRSVTLLYLMLTLANSVFALWWLNASPTIDYALILFLVLESAFLWWLVFFQERKRHASSIDGCLTYGSTDSD